MTDIVAVALLAFAPTDSLPVTLIEVDGNRLARTVAEYVDTTVVAWRILGDWQPGSVVETPEPGEVLVCFIPRDGEGQSTGVDSLPPPIRPGESGSGACGSVFSWR